MIKKAMQPPICAPKVEGFMLKPEYWIEKIGDAEKLIFFNLSFYYSRSSRNRLYGRLYGSDVSWSDYGDWVKK